MSTKRLQKKKAAMQAKKEQQLKKNTVAAKIETSKTEPLKVGQQNRQSRAKTATQGGNQRRADQS